MSALNPSIYLNLYLGKWNICLNNKAYYIKNVFDAHKWE